MQKIENVQIFISHVKAIFLEYLGPILYFFVPFMLVSQDLEWEGLVL